MTRVLTANALPAATALSIGSGGAVDLGGANEQITSLSDYNGSGGTITNSASGLPSVLTVSPTGSTTFSGTIQDGASLGGVKLVLAGSGTLLLAGANTYTGGTDVQNGTLIVASSAGLQDGTSLTVGADAQSIFGASATGTQAASVSASAVPEPGTLGLLVAGLVVGYGVWWRKGRVSA